MAPTIIEFDKTLQERLQEYRDIFSVNAEYDEGYPGSCNDRIFGSQVKDYWRNYLSVALVPRGWRAIWKVPAEKCQLMSLKYPCEVLVEVLSISLETFSSEVEVLSIDDKPLPRTKRSAALIELFPIDYENQDADAWILANDLDKFRFFMQQLWYPWDETDDSASWPDTHLENRLNLLYDIVTGEVRVEDAERIQHLISKSRCIQEEMERAEAAIDECEDGVDSSSCDDSHSDHECDYNDEMDVLTSQLQRVDIPDSFGEKKLAECEETLVVHMVELQKEMKYIQDEVELLTSPSIRNAMANEKLRRYRQCMPVKSCNFQGKNIQEEVPTFSKSVVAVLGKGSMFELKSFLDLIESRYGKEGKYEIEIYPQLQLAKDLVPCAETVFVLCPGFHMLKSSEQFLKPGTVVGGISSDMEAVKTTVFGHSLGKVMIIVDWSKLEPLPKDRISVAKLENVCFEPIGSEAVLLVECGSVSVNQCSFVHNVVDHSSIIGKAFLPSVSVLETYENFGLNSKTFEIPPGSMFSMPRLPATAAFAMPPQRGIAVGAGGKLTAQDCYFEGLHLGIIAYSNAKVYLSNCKFSNCRVAIRVSKGSELVAENCCFENSKAVSLQLLVGSSNEQEKPVKEVMNGQEELVGSITLLDRIPGIQLMDCIFITDEDKHDVLLSAFNEKHNTSESEELSSSGGMESS